MTTSTFGVCVSVRFIDRRTAIAQTRLSCALRVTTSILWIRTRTREHHQSNSLVVMSTLN
jgi:hypothetical protein